ncbi:MAG: glutamine--fructose-6-phosphate aminotransferase [Clostridium sp. 27_14]|nr:MAG: glutamine--fructose-6-phosphate aminotransferase [Clostridium sp. 27_14]
MCGIIGYLGIKKASPILLAGLNRLEYRGYDSAGISTVEIDGIHVVKDKGRVKNLESIPEINTLEGTVGIAHTRWATHGKPSKENAHPHQDNSKTFSVVHNGIIENYSELKNLLLENGYHFFSDTDTEIIPNLIHYYYMKELELDSDKTVQKFLRAVRDCCSDLKGSFALEVICSDFPHNMIVVRKDSPLVIGTCDDEKYISSDIPAILSYTRDFYLLDDLEFVVLDNKSATFYNSDLEILPKKTCNIEWNATASEKNGYADFMSKEIDEQPTAIRETIGSRINISDFHCEFSELPLTKDYLQSINKIYIVACGTAMHAGLSGKNTIEKLCRIPVEVDIASEFRYRNPIVDSNTLSIFISQSGETADTIAALKLAKSMGSKTIAISNVIGSSITREADYSIYTHAGPEIAVASTKAYTSQFVLINILAIYFAEILKCCPENDLLYLKKEILGLPKKVEETLHCKDDIKRFAKKIYQEKDVFFLVEGALKLKEISYIHAEGYPAAEMKHGPIALIDAEMPVVVIATQNGLYEKVLSNIQEIKARKGKVIAFVTKGDTVISKIADCSIELPETIECLDPLITTVPLQLLAYHIAVCKGMDVDQPRNLAKSVTVE